MDDDSNDRWDDRNEDRGIGNDNRSDSDDGKDNEDDLHMMRIMIWMMIVRDEVRDGDRDDMDNNKSYSI